MGRIFAGIIAIIGWLSLVLQFILQMTSPITPEPSTIERFVRFFSYFTITTNIIVAVTMTAIAFFPATRFGEFFLRAGVQAAVASYISIVGVVYSLFLRSVWSPVGWQAVADHALHDLIPVLYVFYWLVFTPKNGIAWAAPLRWLIYPLAYVAYSLIRGAFAAWYPYWFVDVTTLGYATALTNTAFVLVAFLVFGYVFASFAKVLARAKRDVNADDMVG